MPSDESTSAPRPASSEASSDATEIGAETSTEARSDRGRRSGPPNPTARNVVVGLLISMVIAGWVAGGFFSVLLSKHPLVFIGLSATNRNLALASSDLAAWSFFLVGFLRLLAPDPLFFLLGRWYGDSAIRWMERRSPSYGQLLRLIERMFERARYPMVVIAPNNPICLLAGASSMSWASFAIANVIGTIGRLILIRTFSSTFEDLLHPIREFIGDYQVPLLGVTLTLLALTIWSETRAGRNPVEELAHIDEDIQANEDPATDTPA